VKGDAHISEATLPERRRFFFIVGAVNLVFLAFDLAAPAPHKSLVITARALLTVWLMGAPLVLARKDLSPGTPRNFTQVIAVLVALTFGALVWGSDGIAGRYGNFYPLVPLVVAIMVPDDPWASGLCGLVVWLMGLLTLTVDPVFWTMGTLAITLYAAGGAWFHRAGLTRHEAERAQARELERRLAAVEKQRALDERLSVLGRLVASVAHELRSPLTFVSLNVSLLREGTDESTANAALTDVENGLGRIKGLIDDLRSFARDEPDAVGPCELSPVIDEALRVAGVRLGSTATVERVLPDTVPAVKGSPRRLVQVLVNLLVNAADAIDDVPSPHRVRVAVQVEPSCVLVSVEDNGRGIPEDVKARLFTPFVTTKGAKGTGLGLSLSRDYLAAFGATIEAGQSSLGGARLTVRLERAG
jgi:signal transduction histidine kinase